MSFKQKALAEVKEIVFVTIYFFAWFLIFLVLKQLLLMQYSIKITVLGTAFVSALIVGKVVILLGKTSFGNFFRDKPLFLHVAWRSIAYTAIVFLVTLAERTVGHYREFGELGKTFAVLWEEREIHRFLVMNICVALSFVVFNTFSAINRQMGTGELKKMFFSPPK